MKRLTKVQLLVVVALVAFCGMNSATELVVVVKNVKQAAGKVYISVHKGEKAFKEYVSVKTSRVEAKVPSVTFQFELEEGEYSIRVYHDIDDNGELNFNRIMMPREPFAFSNNIKPRFGPPGWKRTKFSVGKEKVTQELTLLGS